jgi:hypothetical protein
MAEQTTTGRRPRAYQCVGCGNPAVLDLTDEEYRSPEYKYGPRRCTQCNGQFHRVPDEEQESFLQRITDAVKSSLRPKG